MKPVLNFTCRPFAELTADALYDIMALRQEVFVVEQNCPYLDADGKDRAAWHLEGRDAAGRLLCYARLLPAGVSYAGYASIGRVVSSPAARGTGAGRTLMEEAIARCQALFGEGVPLKISAQSYLEQFYKSLGFVPTGEHYLEDDIPHMAMVYGSGGKVKGEG